MTRDSHQDADDVSTTDYRQVPPAYLNPHLTYGDTVIDLRNGVVYDTVRNGIRRCGS